jgi:hypothetical protein
MQSRQPRGGPTVSVRRTARGRVGDGIETVRASWIDVANKNFLRRLHHHALTAVEQGLFIIDKQGIIRYRQTYSPLDEIPSGEELLTMTLAVCEE